MDLAEWLVTSTGGAATGHPGGDAVAGIGERLAEVGRSLGDVPGLSERFAGGGPSAPVAMANSVVQNLTTCEGLAVASADAGQPETTWAMFRGRALDAYVAHSLLSGPVADPLGDLESMWTATEDHESLELLEAFTSGSGTSDSGNTADLTRLAVAASFFRGRDRWVPRSEVSMSATFGSSLSLRGRVDVVFGGPGTDLPTVLVEVKSSKLRDSHYAQLRHYVMLATLRHGEPPAAAALWSPEAGLVPIPVAGAARSAVERVAVAARRLRELHTGRAPVLSPGVHCRFCPAADICPRANDYEAPWDSEDLWDSDTPRGGAQ